MATSISPTFPFPNNTGDGILGLGLNNGNGSFFESVIRSGGPFSGSRSPAPVFGFHMTQTGGELIIGGADPSKFEGNLTFVDVDKSVSMCPLPSFCLRFFNADTIQGFWGIQMDSMSVNGNVSVTNTGAILSTANPFITSNNETIAKIYSNIPGSNPLAVAGLWSSTHVAGLLLENKLTDVQMIVPCDSNVTVAITFGGVEFNTTSHYVYNPIPVQGSCLGAFAARINDTSRKQNFLYCAVPHTILMSSSNHAPWELRPAKPLHRVRSSKNESWTRPGHRMIALISANIRITARLRIHARTGADQLYQSPSSTGSRRDVKQVPVHFPIFPHGLSFILRPPVLRGSSNAPRMQSLPPFLVTAHFSSPSIFSVHSAQRR